MASMKRLWKAWPKRRQTLLITVDCGIASHDLVQAFKDRMTIIVTDHHTPPDPLPPAYAILNPKQPGCPYPFKDLAGAGVAYKLCQALWQYLRHDSLPGYTDIGSLSDHCRSRFLKRRKPHSRYDRAAAHAGRV